jgi:asparagine synthase (glutamine-hydrolysing)
VIPTVRAESRAELMQLQFTTGAETIFEGIRRVLPGETLAVVGGRIVERRRRSALPQASWSAGGPAGGPAGSAGEAPPRDEDEALARLDRVLEDSVLFHQRSDVPYGMFLSGGIDSSALLALMARLNDRPVRAFTAGFPGAGVNDERAQARTVAREVGAEHVEVEIGEGDFWSLLPEIAASVDDPVADYAVLPTYRLAREAGSELKVILTGEGGDELFAGYGRYRRQGRPRWLGGGRLRRRGIFDGLGVLREGQGIAGWRTGIDAATRAASLPGRTRLQIAQATDCADWLPNDLLIKLDRCLMAHGVEGRTPFLDPVVANAAFPLADAMKIRRGMGKWLLRRWLQRHLPAALPMSRKRGFTVPVGEWIAARGAALGPLVAAQPGVAEIADADAVGRLFRGAVGGHAGLAAWVLLFYALWHRRHVNGLAPQGDVFETLAAR